METLRAGPLTLTFEDGDLRDIRLGGRQVIQRIYAAVRDRNWATVPGRIENLSIKQTGRAFSIGYDCAHQDGSMDFRWRASITGDARGRVTFEMVGKAHSTFLRNRIGLCVQHPLTAVAQPCTVAHTDGSVERAAFPDLISPHQPFLDIAAVSYQPVPGADVEVRFSGDVFEMEDHRNWTDAGFKTYGTPLALPIPAEVVAGTEIRQKIQVLVSGAFLTAEDAEPGPLTVTLGEERVGALPLLGLGLARSHRLSDGEAAMLKRLRLAYVRADCLDETETRRAVEVARALEVGIEAAITWPHLPSELNSVTELAHHWLVFEDGAPSAAPRAIDGARRFLGPRAVLVAGTNGYFADLNRNRPEGPGWDGCCFSVNPQVHSFYDEIVMENASAQGETIRSARAFAPGKGVYVTPVTLRPRFQPGQNYGGELREPDPRQRAPFCAAWTVASLKPLAEAGAAGVTYFETHGPAGLLEGDTPFPVYPVFEALADFAGAGALRAESSGPRAIAALHLASGARRRALVANLTAEPRRVRIAGTGAPSGIELPPYGVEILDRA